jgi:hypothetical protein
MQHEKAKVFSTKAESKTRSSKQLNPRDAETIVSKTRSQAGTCETMQILSEVNQAECFRRGIDAPRSTIKLEVNPSKLPRDLRAFVADNLYEGYRLGFDDHINYETANSKGYTSSDFELYRPDLIGFMEAVLRAREFQETVDANSKGRDLTFQEWMKTVDEAANNKRQSWPRSWVDAQVQLRAASQDKVQVNPCHDRASA